MSKLVRDRWWKDEIRKTKTYLSGVYSFVFPNGSRYIGGSKDIVARVQTNLSWLRNGKGQTKELLAAYETFGNPKIEVLVLCQPEDIRTFEYLAFDVYAPNLCKKFYGGNAGVICSEQARKNMSDAAKRKDQMCQSKRQLETWADPVIRKRRVDAIRKAMARRTPEQIKDIQRRALATRKERHGY